MSTKISTFRMKTAYRISWPISISHSPVVLQALLFFLLVGGLGIRLLDLKDPPLDFHSTRQLRAEIIARGIYYQHLPGADPQQRSEAVTIMSTMEIYEPPILENLVAWTYRVAGSEIPWVARIYSSLFWVIGGAALYGLVLRMLSQADESASGRIAAQEAALFSLAFYLFLPWSVIASRSFQPDPWMVMWVLLSAYALYCWAETRASSWVWTLLAGLFSSLAILIKVYAGYPIAGMALGMMLSLLRENGAFHKNLVGYLRRPQVWLYALITLAIPAVYYLGLGQGASSFASFWIFSFTGLLQDRKFYIHWLGLIRGMLDVTVFFAALLGPFLLTGRGRMLALGMWAGYFGIGATFPFQIYTHDYYSLILVPLVAISLSPIVHSLAARLQKQPGIWRAASVILLLAISGYYAYVGRSQLYAANYYNEPIPWQRMGRELPTDGQIIAITHDYGNRLKYYGWRMVNRIWPGQGDLELALAAGKEAISDYESYFKDQTTGMDYFLVTMFGDLEAQPALKSILYDRYPISLQGDGYVLFDLRHPKD